mgnify:FL=1
MPSTVSGIVDLVRLRVDHSSLTDAQTLDLVNNGQRRIQREYPSWWQEKILSQTIATVTGTLQTFALPTDMKAPGTLFSRISGAYSLIQYQADLDGLITEYADATGVTAPQWWSQWGGTGYMFPILSSALTTEHFYHALLPDLALTGSNKILENAQELLEYAGVAEYYEYLSENTKAATWRTKLADAVTALLKQQRRSEEASRDPTPRTAGTVRRRT